MSLDPGGSRPATEWMVLTSTASSRASGGRMPGRRLASIVFPEPGGPTKRMLLPPAAATSSARRAMICPRTSARSGGAARTGPPGGSASGPARDLPRSEQERDRDRKVEAGALLSDVRGRQVDGDLSGRKLEAAVSKRREDALAAFPHGRVGQSHDREGRKSGAQVCLDFDEEAVDPLRGATRDTGKHGARSGGEEVRGEKR